MSDKPSITLAGDWSKPAQALVEKISDAIGGLARPYQIMRVAKAEAEADRIRAQGEIEVERIQRRALRRFAAEEARKQANMEQIIGKTLPLLEEKSKPQDVADDWVANFFEKSRIVSDAEMQCLWSNILAREANSPGSVSRKTVNLLSDLDKSDAIFFTRLCGFAWTLPLPSPKPALLIYRTHQTAKIYIDQGITFDALTHLENLGLVRYDTVAGFVYQGIESPIYTSYFGRTVSLKLNPPHSDTLDLGDVLLTRAGEELARICNNSPVDGFFDYICSRWQASSGLSVDTSSR